MSYENPSTKTIGQQNQDEEYLLTDTVEYFTKMHADGEEKGYTCNVKSVDSSGNANYDHYEISVRAYGVRLLHGFGNAPSYQRYKLDG